MSKSTAQNNGCASKLLGSLNATKSTEMYPYISLSYSEFPIAFINSTMLTLVKMDCGMIYEPLT